jgi:hypothetical protein
VQPQHYNKDGNKMRTIRTKVYQFSELSEQAKQKAIEWYLSGNDYSFAWENTKEDAEQIGLKIHSLDDHRPNKGEFIEDAHFCANRIIENHGEKCETFKTAKSFLNDWKELVSKYSDGITLDKVSEDNSDEFDQEADELEAEFLKAILEDYRIMYNQNVDYENSDKAAIEAIEANEYEFTKEGKRF